MKTTLSTLFFALVCFVSAQETETKRTFEIPYDNMEKVKVDLNLSEEQLTKWNEVNDKYHPQLKELDQLDTLDDRMKMKQVRDIYADRDAELKEFIFAAQWEKYQTAQKQMMRERMKARRTEMMEERKKRMEERKKKQEKGDGR